jgi:hypothetical protein
MAVHEGGHAEHVPFLFLSEDRKCTGVRIGCDTTIDDVYTGCATVL